MSRESTTLNCPRCRKETTVNISEYFLRNKSMAFEQECECGHRFKQEIERRRHNRKAVKFTGWYNYNNEIQLEPGIVAGAFVGKGKMTVVDLSLSGLKVKLKKKEDLRINDRLQVEFHLKDYKRTLIRETATIKNIDKKYVGGAFQPASSSNKDLGFYLIG